MRINSINYFENKTRTNKSQNYTTVVNRLNSNLSFRNIYNKDIFFSNIKSHKLSSSSLSPSTNKIKTVSFMGKTVHIVDGGAHADNMKHFASAINFNISVKMHDVETNPKDSNTKQLKSLEEQLKNLNGNPNLKGEYIAIPAVASVALLNLQDQYNRVMGTNKTLTPQNIKANKTSLIEFLEKIYKNPEIYSKSIKYMDDIGQGKEYTYGVIQEINKLIDKGAKVYIPAGHPHDTTLKWMAAQRGLKPELYHFIATGEDKDHLIQDMSNDIKSKNWYDFNLLALSNANVVGLKDVSGEKDYFFAAYDSCITDGARGVYNFSPIRNEENDKLEGYSYTNTLYAEYPFEKFPANDEVANLVKFVGKDAEKVIASEDETLDFLIALENNEDTDNYANKLYPVNEIFSKNEIIREKMALKGDYVDSSLKLFFRKNKGNKM